MAAVSDYFKDMLTGGMKESNSDRVEIHGFDSDVFSSLIELIYTGDEKILQENTEQLLELSDLLLIPAVVEGCKNVIVDKLCASKPLAHHFGLRCLLSLIFIHFTHPHQSPLL